MATSSVKRNMRGKTIGINVGGKTRVVKEGSEAAKKYMAQGGTVASAAELKAGNERIRAANRTPEAEAINKSDFEAEQAGRPYEGEDGTPQPQAPQEQQVPTDIPQPIAPSPTPGVSTGQPSPSTTQATPFTGGAGATQGEQALATLNAQGGKPPVSLGQATAQVRQTMPADNSFENTINSQLAQDPFFVKMLQDQQDYMDTTNQRGSVMDLYKQMEKEEGLAELDAEMMDIKNVLEGSEDAIRLEVQKAGGFATERQILSMVNASNKQNLINYNKLVDLRNNKQNHIDKMVGLATQDREYMDRQFDRQMNFNQSIMQYRDRFVDRSIASLDRTVKAIGFDGLFEQAEAAGTTGLMERLYGMPPGGLQQAADRAVEAKAAQEEAEAFERSMQRDASARGWAGIGLDREKFEYQKALADLEDSKDSASADNIARAAKTVVRDADDALYLLGDPSVSPSDAVSGINVSGFGGSGTISATARIAASKVPGTPEFEIASLIESVKSNIGIDTLLNIKREGSGLGQVPQQQLETLMGVLGRLDIARDPTLLQRDIRDVVTMYNDVLEKAGADATIGGGTAESGQDGDEVFDSLFTKYGG